MRGDRPVTDAARDDEQLAGADLNGHIRQLDPQLTREHEEELVGVRMVVPDELAVHAHDFHVQVVDLLNRARRPQRVHRHAFAMRLTTSPRTRSPEPRTRS